jgi:hypothetical protein
VIEYQLRTSGESPHSLAGGMSKVALAYNCSLVLPNVIR